MAIKNSKQLKDGDIEYKDKLELRKKEFEKIDHDLAEKDREFDLMEKDKDVLEISEKANSFTLKNKPQMRKAAGHTQQLNKNQGGEGNVMAMMMADMGWSFNFELIKYFLFLIRNDYIISKNSSIPYLYILFKYIFLIDFTYIYKKIRKKI